MYSGARDSGTRSSHDSASVRPGWSQRASGGTYFSFAVRRRGGAKALPTLSFSLPTYHAPKSRRTLSTFLGGKLGFLPQITLIRSSGGRAKSLGVLVLSPRSLLLRLLHRLLRLVPPHRHRWVTGATAISMVDTATARVTTIKVVVETILGHAGGTMSGSVRPRRP